jgi:hypothetical protein
MNACMPTHPSDDQAASNLEGQRLRLPFVFFQEIRINVRIKDFAALKLYVRNVCVCVYIYICMYVCMYV